MVYSSFENKFGVLEQLCARVGADAWGGRQRLQAACTWAWDMGYGHAAVCGLQAARGTVLYEVGIRKGSAAPMEEAARDNRENRGKQNRS